MPTSVGCDKYTSRGFTMCSSPCPVTTFRTWSAVSLPLLLSTEITLWPVASIAPVSCTSTWPVFAEIAASCGRRKAEIAVRLVWVPPVKK